MDDILIYRGPYGHTAILTTNSSASSYGVPVLRIEGKGLDDWPDLGPADALPSGHTAARLVVNAMDTGFWTPNDIEAGRKFCAQWPDGPQVRR